MSSGLSIGEHVSAQLKTVCIKPSKCKRSGEFCKAPVVIVGTLKNGNDTQELGKFYQYHRCIAKTTLINGERILSIQLPLPCQYYSDDDNDCTLPIGLMPALCKQLGNDKDYS